MRNDYLERYSALESPVHNLDPRIKVVLITLFIIVVALAPPGKPGVYIPLAALLFSIIFLSGVPLGFVLKRSLVAAPFIIAVGLFNLFVNPPSFFLNLLVKSWLSIMALITVSATTEFSSLLLALERLGVPRLLTTIIAFMYRYIFVLTEQLAKLERARISRSFGRRGIFQVKAAGNILGSLFVNTYERGERIYQAMLARGYHGHAHAPRRLRLTVADVVFSIYFVLSLSLAGWTAVL